MSANKIFMFLITPASGIAKMQNMYCSALKKEKRKTAKKIKTLLISRIWLEHFVVCNLSYLELVDVLFISIRLQTCMYVIM